MKKERKLLNRKVAPPVVDILDIKMGMKPYSLYYLKNGIPVYTLTGGVNEVITIDIVFEAGTYYESKKGIASVTNDLLFNGTNKRNAFAVEECFEYYGAELDGKVSSANGTISLTSLTKHVNNMLPYLSEIITESNFPQAELDIYINNEVHKLERHLRTNSKFANIILPTYLFGDNHPFCSRPLQEDFKSIKRSDVVAFYNTYYVNGNCRIFVSGIVPDDFESRLNEHFGSLPINNNSQPYITYENCPSDKRVDSIINDSKSVQAAVRIARTLPGLHHPDNFKLRILNHVLGGGMGSRLMMNIREDKGYTYDIHSYINCDHLNGYWAITTEAGIEVAKDAVKEVYFEINALREELIEEEELYITKAEILSAFMSELEGPFAQMDRWKNVVLYGLPDNYFDSLLKEIKDTTAEDLHLLANKYLDPESFYTIMVV